MIHFQTHYFNFHVSIGSRKHSNVRKHTSNNAGTRERNTKSQILCIKVISHNTKRCCQDSISRISCHTSASGSGQVCKAQTVLFFQWLLLPLLRMLAENKLLGSGAYFCSWSNTALSRWKLPTSHGFGFAKWMNEWMN